MSDSLIRVAPFYYIHILDNNANTHRLEVGPQTFTRQDHEKIVLSPTPMVVVPPRHYCIIADPYIRKDENTKEPLTDKYGQVKLRHGDTEIRFSEEWAAPFPLLPGETMIGSVMKLEVVEADTALRLVARRDFMDDEAPRVAGDEWLFKGPATYIPRVQVDKVERVRAKVVEPDSALKLQARKAFTKDGVARKAGEEWLVRETGSYLPDVDERVVCTVKPNYLTMTKALHLRAADTFEDVYNVQRKAGEEWLVTDRMAEVHLQDIHEEVVGSVNITVLNKLQYCVVLDPVDARTNKNAYGTRELREGPVSFFLLPGESLLANIQSVYVLGEEEALLLRANEAFVDGEVTRRPGDLWMIKGPASYVPPVEVEVVEKRNRIPLDENEGIYVRDIKTGRVNSVTGTTYLLEAHEELWEKELSREVEELLVWSFFKDDSTPAAPRDKTRVVTYRVPHNSAMQLYNYKTKQSRVVFGPGLVMLEPEEQFSVVSLSGDTPKRPNVIKTLSLMLGPDFMTDVIEVESADHARLRLQLSYNWHFDVNRDSSPEEAAKIFQVRDFVGDACKAIASRVRGCVATKSFDAFHKDSATIIRNAVFGSKSGGLANKFIFNSNNLVITNIDIQSVEPVDQRTRESLMKSVQLAIEITTKKQERNARHDAEEIEQEARGKIDRQKIINMKDAEQETQLLVEMQAATKAVETAGSAKAEAQARAQQLAVEGEAAVEQAGLAASASNIEARSQLDEMRETQMAEVAHEKALADLELERASDLAEIETSKFKNLVEAIKPETIKAIARAGPEMQARLLKGLGLKGYLMTDGNSPINLFNAAKGMVMPQTMMGQAGQ